MPPGDDSHQSPSRKDEFSNWYSQQTAGRTVKYKSHAFVVSSLKVITFLGALLLLALLLIWPLIFTPQETFNLQLSPMESDADETPVMLKPRFQGVDKQNQPYNITAEEAVQESEELVHMKNVSGDITMKGNKWIAISSQEGKINVPTKTAELRGKVNILSDEGFEFTTDLAYIDFDKGTAYGNDPVVGQGPPGILNSNGFAVLGETDEIIFNGPVKMTIYPEAGL